MTLETIDRGALDEAALPLADLAVRMRLPGGWRDIPGERSRLAQALGGAIDHVEARTGRAVLDRRRVLAGRAFGGSVLTVAVLPVTSIVSAICGGVPASVDEVEAEGGRTRIVLDRSLPPNTSVTLTIRAGAEAWEAVPGALREVVLAVAETALDGAGDRDGGGLVARLVAPFRTLRLRGTS